MALYAKDSAVIILNAAEGGATQATVVFLNDEQPMPGVEEWLMTLSAALRTGAIGSLAVERHNAVDNTALKTKIAAWVDAVNWNA